MFDAGLGVYETRGIITFLINKLTALLQLYVLKRLLIMLTTLRLRVNLRSRSCVSSFTTELPKGGVEVRPLPGWAFSI